MEFFVVLEKIAKIYKTQTEQSHKKQKIVDSIKLQVNMQMEDVTVQIENDIRAIAALEVLFLRWISFRQKQVNNLMKLLFLSSHSG